MFKVQTVVENFAEVFFFRSNSKMLLLLRVNSNSTIRRSNGETLNLFIKESKVNISVCPQIIETKIFFKFPSTTRETLKIFNGFIWYCFYCFHNLRTHFSTVVGKICTEIVRICLRFSVHTYTTYSNSNLLKKAANSVNSQNSKTVLI